MEELIARFDRWLREHRPDLHEILRRGVKSGALDACAKRVGFALPADFRALYAWRDGQDGDCEGAFQNNQDFIALSQCEAHRDAMQELVDAGDVPSEQHWNARWLPFLEGAGGDLLCVDMAGIGGGKPGQVIYWSHEDGPTAIESPSLEAWLRAFVTSLERGMWKVDDDENFSANEKKLAKLTAELAPGYPKHLDDDD
jgi:cell wall assembly regulator SMI1